MHADNDEKLHPDDDEESPHESTEDGPPEIADAARQEAEYPDDESNEG